MGRGTLRVYLGAAPGVGKTFAMLDEARRRAERGTDVVVGFVETHGRPKTLEQLDGLEVVPRRAMDHRGSIFEELDLDAVLERKPGVVLVDELAHTNVPGSRNAKRWQDVHEILDAGIDVISTVNVQHLESLNDVTETITGIRQRETVPDEVVRSADQIELVDMSPPALRRRMAHGNVYAADKVDAALSNYFREGNLTALRELALLWMADRVDEGLDRYRAQHDIDTAWAARERIVVSVSAGPESNVLMRRAARIASRRAGGEWRALIVTPQDGLRDAMSPARLAEIRTKAEELGGSVHTVVGDDTAEAILEFARAENASQIVMGASRRKRLSTLLRPGIGERVIAGSGEIDVLIVTHDYARTGVKTVRDHGSHLARRRQGAGYAFGLLAPALVSSLLWITPDSLGLPAESMILMAVVVATALIGGLIPAIVAAVVSGTVLNFLFSPPIYQWTIANPANVVAIVMFIVVGIAVASVVDRAARLIDQAGTARREADALTLLSQSLLTTSDDLPSLLESACEFFGADAAAIIRREDDGSEQTVARHGELRLCVGDDCETVAIDERTRLSLSTPSPHPSLRRLLKAYAAYARVLNDRQTATHAELDRLRLADADRTRTALLAAVSHDLRSPLAAVRAAIDSLRSDLDWSPEDETELLETIDDGTTRLTQLVNNLLDMSRIHTGSVGVQMQEVSLDAAVLEAIQPLAEAGRITVDIAANVVVLADPGLLDRVIGNICENALKYAPDADPIRIDATTLADPGTHGRVVLRVSDRGPGVPDHDRHRLFAPFQRLGDVPDLDGVGLGLAVARGFTEAMNGSIFTDDTPGGGLTVIIELDQA